MYVILSSWMDHPFLKSHFLIESGSQIRKLAESGLKSVSIDLSLSTISPQEYMPPEKTEGKALGDPAEKLPEMAPETITHPAWRPEEVVPPGFRSVIMDKDLEPRKKAEAVKKYSQCMIKKLSQNPTAENIREVKTGVYDIVDMILDEEETAGQLLNITDHDPYTYTHSVNVGILSIMLANRVLDRKVHNLKELGAGFFLHDLGKVKVNSAIINKPGKLTRDEMCQMKKHSEFGYQVLQKANQLSEEIGHIVLQHHERVDGKGYPRGLAKDEIHIYARICSIADVYDALTSERSYKKSMSPFDALMIIRDEMLGHLQKDIFEHLVYMLHGSVKKH